MEEAPLAPFPPPPGEEHAVTVTATVCGVCAGLRQVQWCSLKRPRSERRTCSIASIAASRVAQGGPTVRSCSRTAGGSSSASVATRVASGSLTTASSNSVSRRGGHSAAAAAADDGDESPPMPPPPPLPPLLPFSPHPRVLLIDKANISSGWMSRSQRKNENPAINRWTRCGPHYTYFLLVGFLVSSAGVDPP